MVFNIDLSYYTYYAKDISRVECPNPIYVALSRASHMMTLIHHYENDYFPLIDRERLRRDQMVDFLPLKHLRLKNDFSSTKDIECGVTELIRHLDMETLEEVSTKYTCQVITSKGVCMKVAHTVETQGGHSENVCEINGIAIPINFELARRQGHCSVLEHLVKNSETLPHNHRENILRIRRELSKENSLGSNDTLYLANLFNAYVSGYNCKREQITDYSWLPDEIFQEANKRLHKYINESAEYEKEVTASLLGRKITGHLDIVGDNIIWELKCVTALESIHYIQVLIYGWLYEQEFGKLLTLQVFNVLSDEVIQVKPNCELSQIVAYLIEKRWGKKGNKLDDNEFLKMVKSNSISVNRNSQSLSGCGVINKGHKPNRQLSACLIMSDSDSD